MSSKRANLILSVLFGFGMVIELVSFHAAYHENTFYGKTMIALDLAYLIMAPIIVWRAKGNRVLRIANVVFWAVCLGVVLYGGYLVEYHDL